MKDSVPGRRVGLTSDDVLLVPKVGVLRPRKGRSGGGTVPDLRAEGEPIGTGSAGCKGLPTVVRRSL